MLTSSRSGAMNYLLTSISNPFVGALVLAGCDECAFECYEEERKRRFFSDFFSAFCVVSFLLLGPSAFSVVLHVHSLELKAELS